MNVLTISQSIGNAGGDGEQTNPLGGSGEIWIILHSHSALTLSAGSQSRLIKQHYSRRSIGRQIDVLLHIPAYFNILLKAQLSLHLGFNQIFVQAQTFK